MKATKLFILFLFIGLASCTTVGPKERGVKVSWGGKCDPKIVYEPGVNWGIHWWWDEMVTYDVSQQTIVDTFEFNDRNNMKTVVEIATDFNLNAKSIGMMHVNITDYMIKLKKTVKSAAKEVIPQYSATELNLTKRSEGEEKLSEILENELPAIYIDFGRVQITDVDIPKAIAETAELNAKQNELNKLAASKALEAENNFKAAEWDSKTKAILSQPAMLKLKELEIEQTWANKGVSKYGNNNVFGASTGILLNK